MAKISEAIVEKSAWVEWIHGIRFHVKAVDKRDLSDWLEYAKSTNWDRKTHQKIEEIDNDRFLNKISQAIIDWEGVNGETLPKIGQRFNKSEKKTVYECSNENKLALLKHADGLEVWIIEKMKDIQTFEDIRIEAEKKS
jgi:hypothetical protein